MNDKKFNGEYIFDKNFQTHYSNGVIGGFQGNTLIINFYQQTLALPNDFSVQVDKNNNFIETNPEENKIIRNVTTRIILDEETAFALADWLNANLNKYKEIKEQQNVQLNITPKQN